MRNLNILQGIVEFLLNQWEGVNKEISYLVIIIIIVCKKKKKKNTQVG